MADDRGPMRLVLLAQAGDRAALGELFRLVQAPLHAYLARLLGDGHLAEDVLQDVFVIVWRKLRWLREPDLFRPWVYRIARWEVTDLAVYTLHGWLVREWRIAPISRVQTVDTARGPLQQLLGLADVTVTTASARGAVRIRGLAADDAAELARVLTETTHATSGDAT